MKQFFTFLGIVAMGATAYGQADTDIVSIPDKYFKEELLRRGYDTNGDREISYREAREIKRIVTNDERIADLTGIEAFVNITELRLQASSVTNLDLSHNTALEQLITINNSNLTNINISKNTALKYVSIVDSKLTHLDVSNNTALKELGISFTKITNIDVSKNTALQSLDIAGNEITNIDVSKNTELVDFRCGGNPIGYVDVSHNKKIQYLSYGENTSVSNLMDLPKLKGLELHNIPLANIDYRVLQKLESLSLSGEKYTSVYIAHLSNLKSFSISFTKITNIDVGKNTALIYLNCSNNPQLTSLDVSKNTALRKLYCYVNQLTSLDVSKNTALQVLWCFENQLTSLDVSKNVALQTLYCHNNQLTNLDVRGATALQTLYCHNNQLTSLDVSKNTALTSLYCHNNQLTQLNLANGNNNNLYLSTRNNSNLMCIQVDRGFSPMGSSWYKDAHAVYSDNCNYPSLSTTEVKAENALQILNPVKDNLIIKTTTKVEKIEIYNTAGQLVKVLFRGNTQVQDLAKGIYLLKITTDGGVITEKIIKQ